VDLCLVTFRGSAATLFKCERKEVTYTEAYTTVETGTHTLLCLYKVKRLTSAHSNKCDRHLTASVTVLSFNNAKFKNVTTNFGCTKKHPQEEVESIFD